MPELALIVDDLSSATDCGIQVARSGLQTLALIGDLEQIHLSDDIDVIAIDTDSRSLPPSEAYSRVNSACKAALDAGFGTLYKSVDSTLRGNLGAEVDAALDASGMHLAVIAPAFPHYGRTTLGGRHYYHGVPINKTEFGSDPQAPVREDTLEMVFAAQSKRKSGLVNLATLRAGSAAVAARLADFVQEGVELALFDVQDEADLDRIVESVTASAMPVVWVGSTGLARCVPAALTHRARTHTYMPSLAESPLTLLVAGSASATTHAQLEQYRQQDNISEVEMDPFQMLPGALQLQQEVLRCLHTLQAGARASHDLVLRVASTRQDIQQARALGSRLGKDTLQVSAEIACALAEVTQRLVESIPLRGLILTGGDTARAVCSALGADAIRILAEVEPGIPLGSLVGTLTHPYNSDLLVITKAGAFGDRHTLVNAQKKMKRYPE